VVEENDLTEFMSMAQLAQRDFSAKRESTVMIMNQRSSNTEVVGRHPPPPATASGMLPLKMKLKTRIKSTNDV
jgi:hypothetical protein